MVFAPPNPLGVARTFLASGIGNLTHVERAYKKWREKPFPPGSPSDPLDDLHADLALVDTWVAEAIVPFVEQGVYRPIQVDPLEKLKQIQDRATELAKSGSADDKRLLDE